MNAPRLMFIAGEVSGDARAAELVTSLQEACRAEGRPAPECFGAGGARMREAGVELLLDMTSHAVIGHVEALKAYFRFKELFEQLLGEARRRKPDAVVLVDFSGFNLRFARAVKEAAGGGWHPKVVYFISPQLWASRASRARLMESYVDLLISIIPFEKDWYAEHAPTLRVEYVGHPLMDRLQDQAAPQPDVGEEPVITLLPGSRKAEVKAHLALMLEALGRIRRKLPVRARLHLPNEDLVALAKPMLQGAEEVEMRTGDVTESLLGSALAITKSGTITLECALMRVPAVVIYVTAPMLFYVGRRVVNVKHLAMPNLLVKEPVYQEFVQDAANPANIAKEALELLGNRERRGRVLAGLDEVVATLGEPGASKRAAAVLLKELGDEQAGHQGASS